MGKLTTDQFVLGLSALIGITVLAILHVVSGDAVLAIYSAVAGGALGYVNGKKTGGG